VNALLDGLSEDHTQKGGAGMSLSLIIFSGLPGTGKTTLSALLPKQMRLPIVRLDDVVGFLSPAMWA
jgi:replication-associated recombination protein RarA